MTNSSLTLQVAELSPPMATADPLERPLLLKDALNVLDVRQEPSVLALLGPEGSGKSILLKRIAAAAAVRSPDVLVVRFDLRPDASPGLFQTLLGLRKKVSVAAEARSRKVRFLAFDLATCRYVTLTDGEAAARKLEQELADLSDPAYRSLILTAGKVAGALSLGILNEWIERGLKRALRFVREDQAYTASSATGAIQGLLDRDADNLLALLPGLLASDIQDDLNDGESRRLVFCLDDYGKLWSQGEAQQLLPERAPRDGALRILMEAGSGAAFVLADRSEAFWAGRRCDGRPACYRLMPLPPLDQAACEAYLDRSGVPPDLQDGIVHQSRGLPAWLSLAAQQYRRLRERGGHITPAMLDHQGKDIIAIVQTGLTPSELQTLKHLASALWFDGPLFAALVSGDLSTGYPATAMEEFVKLSFVETLGPGIYAIHDAFRYPLQQWLRAHAAPLIEKLEAARRQHLAQRGLLGAATAPLDAEDTIYEAIKRLQFGQDSPEEALRTIDKALGRTNPADTSRAATGNLKYQLQELQASMAKSQALAREMSDAASELANPGDPPPKQ